MSISLSSSLSTSLFSVVDGDAVVTDAPVTAAVSFAFVAALTIVVIDASIVPDTSYCSNSA